MPGISAERPTTDHQIRALSQAVRARGMRLEAGGDRLRVHRFGTHADLAQARTLAGVCDLLTHPTTSSTPTTLVNWKN